MQMPKIARLAIATVVKVHGTRRSRNATTNQLSTAQPTLSTMPNRCASTTNTSANTAVAECPAMLPMALAEINAEWGGGARKKWAGRGAMGGVATSAPMAGPPRSATTGGGMRKPAVTAIFRTSESQNRRSGDIGIGPDALL